MSLIERILELTDKVEALIADGQWGKASSLEAERRELLITYVAEEGRGAAAVQELYDRSLNSLREVARQKSAATGDASRLIRNSRALDAYMDNAGAPTVRGGT